MSVIVVYKTLIFVVIQWVLRLQLAFVVPTPLYKCLCRKQVVLANAAHKTSDFRSKFVVVAHFRHHRVRFAVGNLL